MNRPTPLHLMVPKWAVEVSKCNSCINMNNAASQMKGRRSSWYHAYSSFQRDSPDLVVPCAALVLFPSVPFSLSLSLTSIIARETVTASFGAHPSALVALTPYLLRFCIPGVLLTRLPESLGWQVWVGDPGERQRWEEAGRWVCHDRMGSETLVRTWREFRLSEGSWMADVHTDRIWD